MFNRQQLRQMLTTQRHLKRSLRSGWKCCFGHGSWEVDFAMLGPKWTIVDNHDELTGMNSSSGFC